MKNTVAPQVEVSPSESFKPDSKPKFPMQDGLTGVTETTIEVADNPSIEAPAFWQEPTLLGPALIFLASMIVIWWNGHFQQKRLEFEEGLAESKFEYEKDLAGKKYDSDIELEERKLQNSVSLSDWQRRSEFAEEELTTFYEALSTIRSIRSPVSYSADNDDRPGRADETEQLREARDRFYPVLRRANLAGELMSKFFARRFRAIALFGDDAAAPYIGVWNAYNSVRIAGSMLMRDDFHIDDPRIAQNRLSMEEKIWEGLAKNDMVERDLQDAIVLAEGFFRPVISDMPRPKAPPDQ